MKPSEYEAHFVLWAAFKSPLLIGCDLSKMSDDTLRILTNEEVIAVSQDRLGKQAKRLRQESGPRDYWVGSSRPIRTGMRGGWLSRLTGRSGGDFTFSLSRDIGLLTSQYATIRYCRA